MLFHGVAIFNRSLNVMNLMSLSHSGVKATECFGSQNVIRELFSRDQRNNCDYKEVNTK